MSFARPSPEPFHFRSALPDPRLRFLASVVAFCQHRGLRTPATFLRHFPPADLAAALDSAPELRALLMERATGMRREIAIHKSPASVVSDLRLGLEHGQIDPTQLTELIHPDRLLAAVEPFRVWRFISEDKFWLLDARDGARYQQAREVVSHALQRALAEGLVGTIDVICALTSGPVDHRLPRELLAGGTEALATHVPLAVLWRVVIVDLVARPAGWATAPRAAIDPSRTPRYLRRPRSDRPLPDDDVAIDAVIDQLVAEAAISPV